MKGIKVNEIPIRIGGRTFHTFEDFYQYVSAHKASEDEALQRLKGELDKFEQRYGMSSEEFYETIVGTPAEDEIDFIIWAGIYEVYRRKTAAANHEPA
jgi:hypothetical protein